MQNVNVYDPEPAAPAPPNSGSSLHAVASAGTEPLTIVGVGVGVWPSLIHPMGHMLIILRHGARYMIA